MLVTVDDCRAAFQDILDGPEYEEDVIENINIRAISVQYNDFAKRISKFTGQSSDWSMVLRSWNDVETSLFSTLILTVKSHKNPGEVKTRNIHSSPKWKLAGLSAWLQ
eukprot:11676876-Karenia_brevis.AAC.1